jgi:hypothetical protein
LERTEQLRLDSKNEHTLLLDSTDNYLSEVSVSGMNPRGKTLLCSDFTAQFGECEFFFSIKTGTEVIYFRESAV